MRVLGAHLSLPRGPLVLAPCFHDESGSIYMSLIYMWGLDEVPAETTQLPSLAVNEALHDSRDSSTILMVTRARKKPKNR